MTADRLRAEAALARLSRLHPKLIDLGLDRGYRLLKKLGNPHHHLPSVIHVAGTNGKGSCLAFIRAVFEGAGLSAHVYTSPHLVRFHERIRISGDLIGDKALADLLEEVEATNGHDPMTFFEITTAAALLAFSRHDADVVLLETGLGGRADSTNVITSPRLTIITPIARDHEHFLGSTLTAIAGEKAGIMRAGVPCFSAEQDLEAEAVLIAHAEKIGAPFYLAGRDFMLNNIKDGVCITANTRKVSLTGISLKGAHQGDNAGLITAAMMMTFPEFSDAAFQHGAAHAQWTGRVQHLSEGVLKSRCPDGIQLWLDGAHNAHGAAALAKSLKKMNKNAPNRTVGGKPYKKNWVLICGALNTRPPADFLKPLKSIIDRAITITIPQQEAALPAEVIKIAATEQGITTYAAANIDEALALAIAAAKPINGNIIIAGSLYLAGHVLSVNNTLPQ